MLPMPGTGESEEPDMPTHRADDTLIIFPDLSNAPEDTMICFS